LLGNEEGVVGAELGGLAARAARMVELMGRPGLERAKMPERTTIAIVPKMVPRRAR